MVTIAIAIIITMMILVTFIVVTAFVVFVAVIVVILIVVVCHGHCGCCPHRVLFLIKLSRRGTLQIDSAVLSQSPPPSRPHSHSG